MTRAAALLFPLLLVLLGCAGASEIETTRPEGHPRGGFPLAVSATPAGDAGLDAALRRAVDDWNRVSRIALGLDVFRLAERESDAQVIVRIERLGPGKLMGQTELNADERGVLQAPVRIAVMEPTARGETPREVLFYQVVAHELGHALGLPHTRDPRSIMCCVRGSIDFNDPAIRQAYMDARRHPDVGSAEAQLKTHYEGFWKAR